MTYLWIAGAVVLAAAAVLTVIRRNGTRTMLAPTIVGAIGAFLLVSGWLSVVDANAAKNEAIKTGGLAGGSVIALYALWLNDRRRRTEEARQDLENQRAEHDRSRVADERFARSVELLGHETDQVRVGALHALAGLAKSRDEYTQTVLDILCSYLRRPFEKGDDRHELEVRLSAQRLIADLLPLVDEVDAEHYDLNLTNAYLEYFDISGRQVGRFTARSATFHESNSFHHTRFHGDVYLTDSESLGRLHAHHVVFESKAWFSGFTASGEVNLWACDFRSGSKFAGGKYGGRFSLNEAKFREPPDITDLRVATGGNSRLPEGWTVDESGLVRSE